MHLRGHVETCLLLVTQSSHRKTLMTTDSILSHHFNGHFPGEPGLAGVY